MAEQTNRQIVAEKAIVHADFPVQARLPAVRTATVVDRSFELPTALYGWTAALFLGFMAVMALGFAHPELALPIAVIVLLIVAFFVVPALWALMAPESSRPAKSWSRFQREGIQTPFGRTTARDATVQVLILPVLIFLWGIATVTIAALV